MILCMSSTQRIIIHCIIIVLPDSMCMRVCSMIMFGEGTKWQEKGALRIALPEGMGNSISCVRRFASSAYRCQRLCSVCDGSGNLSRHQGGLVDVLHRMGLFPLHPQLLALDFLLHLHHLCGVCVHQRLWLSLQVAVAGGNCQRVPWLDHRGLADVEHSRNFPLRHHVQGDLPHLLYADNICCGADLGFLFGPVYDVSQSHGFSQGILLATTLTINYLFVLGLFVVWWSCVVTMMAFHILLYFSG